VWTRQFALPTGVLGRVVGRFMARANATLTRRAVEAVPLAGGETVLEIGCGPGTGLVLLATALPAGRVFGADPSPVMRAQATARVRAHPDRVHLVDATADTLPWQAPTFDVVYAVNSVQLWQPLPASLARVRDALLPGGVLVIGLTEHAVQPDGTTVPRDLEHRLVAELQAAGFVDVSTVWERGGNGEELLILAHHRLAA